MSSEKVSARWLALIITCACACACSLQIVSVQGLFTRILHRALPSVANSSAIRAGHAALLEQTSMYGLGVDARRQVKRRTHFPLVTWSHEAVQTLRDYYWQVQDPHACDRVLYVYPMNWGLTSQMRDYSNAAIIALAARRTLHFVADGRRQTYCSEARWLECFFEPLSGQLCRRASAELRTIPRFSANSVKDLVDTLHGDTPVVHLNGTAVLWYNFGSIVGSRAHFPSQFWRGLLKSRMVQISDHSGRELNATALERDEADLYHASALSALRTMLAPILFDPVDEIKKLAGVRASQLVTQRNLHREHCVAVHLRWTDKKRDGGVAAKMNFTVDHVATALDRLEHLTGRAYRCILLLSDDDEAATSDLRSLLGDTYVVKPISRVRDLFPSQEEYDIYKQRGHAHVLRRFSTRDSDVAYAYTREVFIDIHAALLTADYLIGPGSSGVSQLLAQYMGARRRVDANAVALWQEDVLMVGA